MIGVEMAVGKQIRKDSSGFPGTLISKQVEKEIDKTIYTEATEFEDWLEEFVGQYH